VLAVASLPTQIVGIGMALALGNAPTYQSTANSFAPIDNTGLAVATVAVNVLAPVALAVGIALILTSVSSVKDNDAHVARLGPDGLHF
jgi:hypothetical protein